MKAEFKVGNLTLVAEGTTPESIFRELATLQAVFEDASCRKCNKTNLQYVVRKVEDDEFFELRCKDCGAKLTFGVSKADKQLYPKRYMTDSKGKAVKDENDKPIVRGKWGWTNYNRETGKEEQFIKEDIYEYCRK